MKIIKEGEWKQRQTCRGCSSKLEFEIRDLEFEQVLQQDESFDLSYFVICPVCSRKMIQNGIPDKIKKGILDGRF